MHSGVSGSFCSFRLPSQFHLSLSIKIHISESSISVGFVWCFSSLSSHSLASTVSVPSLAKQRLSLQGTEHVFRPVPVHAECSLPQGAVCTSACLSSTWRGSERAMHRSSPASSSQSAELRLWTLWEHALQKQESWGEKRQGLLDLEEGARIGHHKLYRTWRTPDPSESV